MIIDAHIHLWSPLRGDGMGTERQALSWGRARQGDRIYYCCPPSFEDSQSTYQRALAHMDMLGIDKAVVLQEFMDGKQDDYLTQVRKLAPKRFSCTALFDQAYLDDPLGSYQQAVAMGLQGFLVKTPSPFDEIATPRLQPLWQACASDGLPVVLKNGTPQDIRKLVKLAPGLKIVESHFAGFLGGSREEWEERLRIAASEPDVYVDAGAITFRYKYPFPESQQALQHAVDICGADKISWGSDYPRPGLVVDASYKQQLEFITVECDFLSEEQRAAILGGTADKVYCWER